MDYSRENVVHVIPTNGPENWNPNSADGSLWATEEDYRLWNNPEIFQTRPTFGDHPPSKKSRNSLQEPNPRSKAAFGKMFFKTKLCCKFRQGSCPYITNCNFAHSVEELRRPPPNWQDIVAAREEDKGGFSELREEFQIPSFGSSGHGPEMRSSKGRHCKKFYTDEGCPYGDSCTFLHDESSRSRESVAISLGPRAYGGGGGGGGGGNGSGLNSKLSNWKTRICNKWEITGYCPFGSSCHFAHGSEELYRHAGGAVEGETRDSSAAFSDSKRTGVASKTLAETLVTSVPSAPRSDVYHVGVPSQRTSLVIQRPGQAAHKKWKGPDKISRIYGDWIDDVK